MRDYRYSADGYFIRYDDRDFDRYGDDTRERIHARGDEARHGQHVFVAVVISEARNVKIGWARRRRPVTRKMRVHLPRVVVRSFVVVEMHVRHGSGDGAHLNCNG